MPPKRKASNKKEDDSKRSRTDDTGTSLSLITDSLFYTDVVSVQFFSFLDVRHLLRFVSVCKEFQKRLKYEHVVRATMMSGGFPQISLERMVRPIREGGIWVPSPLRLLQVVCGKRCEVCHVPNRFVCDSFAVFLCHPCLKKHTKLFPKSKQAKALLEAPGIVLGPRNGPKNPHSYIMLAPLRNKIGEKIGPLATWQDVEAMTNTTKTLPPPSEKLAAWVQECNSQQPHAEKARQAILDAVGANRQDAEDRKATMKQEKLESTEKNLDAKRKKCDEVIATLVVLLKDDHGLVAKIEAREWNLLDKLYRFEDAIVQKVLAKALKAPSKLNKKKIEELGAELTQLTQNQELALQHIQKIIALVDHEETTNVVHYEWANWKQLYHFRNESIRKILEEPLKNPKSLTDTDLEELAAQAKKVVTRKAQVNSIMTILEQRLDGLAYVNDIKDRTWHPSSWCYKFTETYVHEILYEPLLSPQDITDEKLNDLEKKLRAILTKMAQFCAA